MNYENLETTVIRQQAQYIKKLEEQLAVYGEKDKAQEALIEKMDQTLEIFAGEITRLKEEKDEKKGE